jgi:hypothetical protein
VSQSVTVTSEAAELNTESAEVRALPRSSDKASAADSQETSTEKKQQQSMDGMLRLRHPGPIVRVAHNTMPILIAAPKGNVVWRIGAAGVVERSTDGGSSWALQPTPVNTDLLAGSATSDQVCWIVGRAGTILRTTDGGAHWTLLSLPVPGDFDAVSAVDAQQATISDALNHQQFHTKDGGKTWTRLPNP